MLAEISRLKEELMEEEKTRRTADERMSALEEFIISKDSQCSELEKRIQEQKQLLEAAKRTTTDAQTQTDPHETQQTVSRNSVGAQTPQWSTHKKEPAAPKTAPRTGLTKSTNEVSRSFEKFKERTLKEGTGWVYRPE